MRFHIYLFFVWMFVSTSAVFCQQQPSSSVQLYSESKPYEPRKVSKKEDKRGKDKPIMTTSGDQPIRIRVSVLDPEGKSVVGLSKGDFKLFVDDQEIDIESVEPNTDRANYIFLIDNSYSVARSRNLVLQAERVLDQLPTGTRAMVIAFNSSLKVVCELTDNRDDLKKAIRKASTPTGNGRSIYDHVQYLSTSIIPQAPKPTAVILFSDGVDTASGKARFDTSLRAAEEVNAAYYVIYQDTYVPKFENLSVASAKSNGMPFPTGAPIPQLPRRETKDDYDLGKAYLNDLMALSGGHTVRDASDSASSALLSSELPNSLSSQYVLTFTPRPVSRIGQHHQIRVRVSGVNLRVLTRGSYIAQ